MSLGLQITNISDGISKQHSQVRLLTLGASLTLLDAVLRRNPPHSQNDLSRVYSGALRPDAQVGTFAMQLPKLAKVTEDAELQSFIASKSLEELRSCRSVSLARKSSGPAALPIEA